MYLDLFCICDKVQTDIDKFSVIGIHFHIFSTEYPAKHPSLSVAAVARFKREEGAIHNFHIYIVSPDGKKLPVQYGGTINAQHNQDDDPFYYSNIFAELPNLVFETRGRYKLVINFDNQLPFDVPLLLT